MRGWAKIFLVAAFVALLLGSAALKPGVMALAQQQGQSETSTKGGTQQQQGRQQQTQQSGQADQQKKKGPGEQGPSVPILIGELIALMLLGRLLGEAMLRLHQPAVMGQLIAGVLLGPSFFGWLLPDWQKALFPGGDQKAMIDAVAQVGILLLLLLTGMEADLKLVRNSGRAALFASLMGVVVPFVCGITLGEFIPDSLLQDPAKRLVTALFLGTALSIASVQIVGTVVREMNFVRRTVGQVIMATAIIDDSIGWILISLIFGIALHGSVEPLPLATGILGTIAFLVASLTLGRRAVFFVIRWVNDNFVSDFAVVTAILLIMCSMALITNAIGVHTVLGAFVSGVLVGESPILTRHIGEQLRGFVTAFFAPVFFGIAGLRADLTALADPRLALLTLGLIAVASIGKFTGAFAGAELGGLTKREGFALACGMNARGSTEVIVATIGLSMGALSQNLFTMIVAMAILTTTAMPPTLRWALSRIPMRKDEKKRLEREELEAHGFVPNLERLLIAVDDSPNGRFASRVAGLIAGTRGMPTTVLHIAEPKKIEAPKEGEESKTKNGAKVETAVAADQKQDVKKSTKNGDKPKDKEKPEGDLSEAELKKAKAEAELAEEVIKEAAEATKKKQKKEEKTDAPVDVTTVVHEAPTPEFIAEEAEKGYDLMIIGLEKTTSRGTNFHESVTGLAMGFEGPLAIVDTRAGLHEEPGGDMDILVPVNGTEVARRGAEVAITMARATKANLTVLYVAPRPTNRGARRSIRTRRHEEAILKDIVAIADGYNMSIRTAVLADKSADEAILKESKRRKSNLILLGVGHRPGEKLFFGDTASSLLQNAECSLLFVAS